MFFSAKTMRSAYCSAAGELSLREVPRPTPTHEGEALLEVECCGICGSDLHWYTGAAPPPAVCPGHEICAVVAGLGPGRHDFREGDRVAVEATISCGECRFCIAGTPQLCKRLSLLGVSAPGGLADFTVTPSRHLYAVPAGVDAEMAQLTEPLAVGVHSLRLAGLEPDQRVLIVGGGTIGLLAVPAARAAGAGEVVVLARRPHQRAAALALGANRAIEPIAGSRRTLPDLGEGDFDVVLDAVTNTESLDDALSGVRPGGAVVLLGIAFERPRIDALRLLMQEVRVIGSMCYGRTGERSDFDLALDILSREGGRLRSQVVTHRVGLDNLDKGFRAAADKGTGSIKVSIAVSEKGAVA